MRRTPWMQTPPLLAVLGGLTCGLGCDETTPTVEPPPVARDARTLADQSIIDAQAPSVDAAQVTADAEIAADATAAPDAAADAATLPVDATPNDAAPRDAAVAVADAAARDAGPMDEEAFVRFAVLGDVGKGNTGQHAVARALADVCTERGGCDHALLLGDNIYDTGVDDADDPQWQEKFEAPYAVVDFPFYATLGNHDYGAPEILQDFAGGLGIDARRGQAQLDYAARSDKFNMPDVFYRFEVGPVEFVSLNTASMFWRDLPFIEQLAGFDMVNARQEETLPRWAAESTAPWRVAFAHHPYLSNGRHGNAGSYDFVFIEGLIGSGTGVRDFYDDLVIGEFDLVFAGHDHSQQDLGRVDGSNLVVSGAGASTTDIVDDRNDFNWQSEQRGFVIVEASPRELTMYFYDVAEDAEAEMPWRLAHSRTIRP